MNGIGVADEVRHLLGEAGLRSLAAICRYRPAYRCPECSRHGDVSVDASTVLVYLPPHLPGATAWLIAHARCTPSTIRTWQDYLTVGGRSEPPHTEPNHANVGFDIVAPATGTPTPVVVFQPVITNLITITSTDGGVLIVDQQLEELLRAGFVTVTDVDHLPYLDRWVITFDSIGTLIDVTAPPETMPDLPDRRWMYTPTPPVDSPSARQWRVVAPPPWWRLAQQRVHATVLVTPPHVATTPHDGHPGTHPPSGHWLREAIGQRRVIGARITIDTPANNHSPQRT